MCFQGQISSPLKAFSFVIYTTACYFPKHLEDKNTADCFEFCKWEQMKSYEAELFLKTERMMKIELLDKYTKLNKV